MNTVLDAVVSNYFFDDDRMVIEKFSIETRDNEILGITGPNGCGKTTLFRLLSGLDGDCDRVIKVENETLHGPCRKVQLVFQDHRLLPWGSVEDNLIFALKGNEKDSKHLIDGIISAFNLDELRKRRPSELSGGQRQNLAIARALVDPPAVLLLDEPFRGLDVQSRMEVINLLHTKVRSLVSSMLIITHDIETLVMLSDRILLFEGPPLVVNDEIIFNSPSIRPPDDNEANLARNKILKFFKDRSISQNRLTRP